MKLNNKNLILTILAIILTISSYFLIRELYYLNNDFPYSQEIVAVFLGTIVTILITAILLNKQTEVELLKEENLKLFEFKADIYNELFKYLEDVFMKQDLTDSDIIKLKLINQKLATIASKDVLSIFGKFIDIFNDASQDNKIVGKDVDEIFDILSELSNAIRYDLLEGKHIEKESEKNAILKQIRINTDHLKNLKMIPLKKKDK
ncbi:conserved hypothetical protein [Deferribacter desulfuricans SSM1]|uniref:Uncharacterized protein n=1 Tax=Deferribacter desulfuricans (strain DSM 14783 / JCM 11476 / NBRC 101012 / SSM1) TaxID=639282 RepID=D3PDW5_DEFDS|nr:hypothetical protein [Deferribacter desulfuricans]BAI80788.1 conserved hypothetical protein [Deferribacter desulfuricans SSM1]